MLKSDRKRVAALLGPDRFVVARSWPEARRVVAGWLAAQHLRFLSDAEAAGAPRRSWRPTAHAGPRRDG